MLHVSQVIEHQVRVPRNGFHTFECVFGRVNQTPKRSASESQLQTGSNQQLRYAPLIHRTFDLISRSPPVWAGPAGPVNPALDPAPDLGGWLKWTRNMRHVEPQAPRGVIWGASFSWFEEVGLPGGDGDSLSHLVFCVPRCNEGRLRCG